MAAEIAGRDLMSVALGPLDRELGASFNAEQAFVRATR